MRHATRRPLAYAPAVSLALLVLAWPAAAQQPPPPSTPPPGGTVTQISQLITLSPPGKLDTAEVAGLPEGASPEVLTWPRVYALALARDRGVRADLARSFDPKALDEQAGRLAVADFARFRKEFEASAGAPGRPFRDPAGTTLALLARLQAVESARWNLTTHEGTFRVLLELVKGESSNLGQLDLDEIASSVASARLALTDKTRLYRDLLDRWRVELGLSPEAPIVPNRDSLAAFQTVFDQAARWSIDPNRKLEDLPALVGQLPSVGDVMLGGRASLASLDKEPRQLERVLSTVARTARANQRQGRPGDPVALVARRRVRLLVDTRKAYETERSRFVLLIRLKSQVLEDLVSPPTNPEVTAPRAYRAMKTVLSYANRLTACQDRLVSLWTTFQRERLALYQDLGALPFVNWDAFYGHLQASPTEILRQQLPPPEAP
jgi:hypothetical protein